MPQSVSRMRSIGAVVPPLIGSGSAAVGSGLLHTLLPLRLSQLGYEAGMVGVVVTGYSIGFIIGCLTAAVLIRRVGHVRACAAFAASAALANLALDWMPSPAATTLLVGTVGVAGAGLAVVTESWLNELVPSEWRGRVFTIYILALALCYGSGQLIGLNLDLVGSRVPILTAAFYILALIPVTAIDVAGPKPPVTARVQLLRAFRVSPVGAMSCLQTGLVSATFAGIGPLYGEALGFGQRPIILMMAAAQIGGMALQFPLGLLSDLCDRRYLLIGMSVGLAALSGIMIGFGAVFTLVPMMVLFGCVGGVGESFYPIGVAHTNDRADPADYVPISANLLLLWALGSAIGPIVGSVALQQIGAAGFFWYVLVLSVLFALFAAWRIRRAGLPPAEGREEFVAYPTTSPNVLEWIPFRKLRRK